MSDSKCKLVNMNNNENYIEQIINKQVKLKCPIKIMWNKNSDSQRI